MENLLEKLEFIPSWYQSLLDNGNEKIRLIQFIKENFINESTEQCLEVGMGTQPIFSTILSSYIKKYTIIEKNNLTQINLPTNVQLINKDFEAFDTEEKFDLIILSHVIYYFNDLKSSIEKSISMLTSKGKAIFVVNGTGNHYGLVKHAFAKISQIDFKFTYDLLLESLRDFPYKEYTIETSIFFETHAELYNNLKLFFDLFPQEYSNNEIAITNWLKQNILGNRFLMDQKLIVVENSL